MEPIRFKIARQFIASARDMGDKDMIACAIRVYNGMCYPRTQPYSASDKAIFIEWQNDYA